MNTKKKFAGYKPNASSWITLMTGDYYPDILEDACDLYGPVLRTFEKFLKQAESSQRLLTDITTLTNPWMRIQLLRVFRKYVSPDTPVEMLKRKRSISEILSNFGHRFRKISIVQRNFLARPIPDEAICAILWEYKSRGKKGYDLTERMFDIFASILPNFTIKGPKRAGKDILLGTVFKDYPNPKRPVDFIIFDKTIPLAIGFARYDSDRGGAQEDDRTGGYKNTLNEILTYTRSKNLSTKVLFINDGPGLLLGSMWNDYAVIEESRKEVMVATLRMIPERITETWLKS